MTATYTLFERRRWSCLLASVAVLTACSGSPKADSERNVRTGPARVAREPVPQPLPGTVSSGAAAQRPDGGAIEPGKFYLTGLDQVGTTVRQVATGKLEFHAGMETDGHTISLDIALSMTAAQTTETLAVTEGSATKMRETIERMRAAMQVRAELDGQRHDKSQPTLVLPLEGAVLIAERQGDLWLRRLESGTPTPDQEKLLADSVPVTEFYPREGIAVGHSWQLPTNALRIMAGGFLQDTQGQATAKLTDVVPCGKHTCAVVTFAGEVAGTVAGGVNTGTMRWQLRGECKHDLVTGADVQCQFGGPIEGQMALAGNDQAQVQGLLEFTAKETVQ